MSESSPPSDPDPADPQPLQGQVRHMQLSARVPQEVGRGEFSNGVMILMGAYEIVLDFVLRLGEPNRIVARVILPHAVAQQLIKVLQDNLQAYEYRFGPTPRLPRLRIQQEEPRASGPSDEGLESGETHPENLPQPPSTPHIEDIYDELRLPDEMLSGTYANAVLVRHSASEFCFDFITNIYPRSAVSRRVYLATPHVPLFLQSLVKSLNPGT
ncbi:MAG: DUF3467 domain-containing protein [Planctomyces sp.]|nr:DUF3467 domain-containing protein [Planctomyces sp.]